MSDDPSPQHAAATSPRPPTPPRLLDQLREAARQRGHPEATAAVFADCCRRLLLLEDQLAVDRSTRRILGQVGPTLRPGT